MAPPSEVAPFSKKAPGVELFWLHFFLSVVMILIFLYLLARYNAGILVYVTTTCTPTAFSGVNVMYDGVKYDPGNNFNLVTSEYRAPMNGQYLVASHLFSTYYEGHQRILVNGIEVAYDHMYDQDEQYTVTEPTLVLNLNANDSVAIQRYSLYGGDVMLTTVLLFRGTLFMVGM